MFTNRMTPLFIFIFFFFSSIIFTQTNVDSLIQLSNNSSGKEKVDLLMEIGKNKISTNREEARECYLEGLSISQDIEYTLGIAKSFRGLGYYFYFNSETDSLRYYAEKAYYKALESGDTATIAGTSNLVGVANFKISKFREAAEYYKISAKYFLALRDTARYLTILNNIGATSLEASDLDTAVVYIHKAIRISDKIGDEKRTAKLLTDLGNLYGKLSRRDDAFKYARKALEICKKIGDEELMSINFTAIGGHYRGLQEYEKALEYYNKALNISLKYTSKYNIAKDYTNIANVYYDQKKFGQALQVKLEAHKIFLEQNDLYNISQSSSDLADIYRELGDKKSAIRYYNIAETNAKELNNFRFYSYLYGRISDYYEVNGNTDEGLKYFKLFIAYRDSIAAQDKEDQISRLQTEYETEKKEQEIELLNKEKVLADISLDNEILLRNSFIGGTVTFLIVAVGLFNRYRYKSKTNKKLSEFNTKLTDLNDQLEDELNQAASYIESLLPEKLNDKIKTDWMFIPSSQLGGDSFGYSWLSDNLFSFYLIDVSGHGVGAALLSTTVLNLLKSKTLANTDFTDPASVLNSLNNNFDMEEHEGKYFAIWYGVLDISTNELTCASAMHPPALSVGPYGLLKLGKKDIMIGAFPEYDYKNTYYQLKKGDKLYLFSDGCFELENETDGGLEFDNFTKIITDKSNTDNPLRNIFQNLSSINMSDQFGDDYSMLQLELLN